MDHWDRNNLGQPLLSHGYLPLYSIDRLFYIFLPKEYLLIINKNLFLIKLFFVYKTTILIIKNNDVYNPILSKLNISILFSGFFIYCIVFQSQLTQLLFLFFSLFFIFKYKKNNKLNNLIKFFLSVFIFCSSGMLDDSFNILIWVNLFLLYYLIKKKILFKQFCFLIILQLPSVIFLFSNLYPLLIESSVNFSGQNSIYQLYENFFLKILKNLKTFLFNSVYLMKLFLPLSTTFYDPLSGLFGLNFSHIHGTFPSFFSSLFLYFFYYFLNIKKILYFIFLSF